MTAKIIGADIVPTKRNKKLFEENNVYALIGDKLKNEIHGADFSIFNLETPITDSNTPIFKVGPNLSTNTKTIGGLKGINPCFFTLANNHILDQGEQGLIDTINELIRAGINYAGAGLNINEAQKPYI